jgi:hypothetical protein
MGRQNRLGRFGPEDILGLSWFYPTVKAPWPSMQDHKGARSNIAARRARANESVTLSPKKASMKGKK